MPRKNPPRIVVVNRAKPKETPTNAKNVNSKDDPKTLKDLKDDPKDKTEEEPEVEVEDEDVLMTDVNDELKDEPKEETNPESKDATATATMPTPIEKPVLKLWQAKTLKSTIRTPLPSGPNSRPWTEMSPPKLEKEINKTFDYHKYQNTADVLEKKVPKPATSRKVWKRDEIEKLATMRENGASWEDIQAVFPWRSIEGLKQVWWKHRLRVRKLAAAEAEANQEEGTPAPSTNSEVDMDVDQEAFDKNGNVKWNFRRKS